MEIQQAKITTTFILYELTLIFIEHWKHTDLIVDFVILRISNCIVLVLENCLSQMLFITPILSYFCTVSFSLQWCRKWSILPLYCTIRVSLTISQATLLFITLLYWTKVFPNENNSNKNNYRKKLIIWKLEWKKNIVTIQFYYFFQ